VDPKDPGRLFPPRICRDDLPGAGPKASSPFVERLADAFTPVDFGPG